MEGSFNFLRIVSSPPMRMDQVDRYSGVYQVSKESNSVHTTDVLMIGYLIINKLNTCFDENINIGAFLEKALLHDIDEVLTGDVPRTTKYYNQEILGAMRDLADDAVKQLVDVVFDGNPRIYEVWDSSKDGKEGIIVKVADFLSVATKVLKEVDFLNNNYFLKVAYEVRGHLSNMVDYIKSTDVLSENSRNYLAEVTSEALLEINKLWEDRKDLAIKYGMLDGVLKRDGEYE